MSTAPRSALIVVAAIAAYVALHIVIGVVASLLHWAFILAIVGGVGYVAYSLTSPNKSLGWKSRILP